MRVLIKNKGELSFIRFKRKTRCKDSEVSGMALHEAVEKINGKVCHVLVDEDGIIVYNSCEENIVSI